MKGQWKPRKGNLLIPVFMVLLLMNIAITAVYQIRRANLVQYQLLADRYRLEIMLEIALLELSKEMQESGTDLLYTTHYAFHQGEVLIRYNQSRGEFVMNAKLKNGQEMHENIRFEQIESVKEEIEYVMEEFPSSE